MNNVIREAEMNPLFKANEIARRALKSKEQKILDQLAAHCEKMKWVRCEADDARNKVNLVVVK